MRKNLFGTLFLNFSRLLWWFSCVPLSSSLKFDGKEKQEGGVYLMSFFIFYFVWQRKKRPHVCMCVSLSNSQTLGGFVCGLWFPGSTAGATTAAANIIILIIPWPVPGSGFWGSSGTLPIVNLFFFTVKTTFYISMETLGRLL